MPPPATRPVPLSPAQRVGRPCGHPRPGHALIHGPGWPGVRQALLLRSPGASLPLSPGPRHVCRAPVPLPGREAASPRTWEIGDPFPVQLVGDADLDLIQGVQDVQLRKGQPVGARGYSGEAAGPVLGLSASSPAPAPPPGAISKGLHTPAAGRRAHSAPSSTALLPSPASSGVSARSPCPGSFARSAPCRAAHADPALHPLCQVAPGFMDLPPTRPHPDLTPAAPFPSPPSTPGRTRPRHPLWPRRAGGSGCSDTRWGDCPEPHAQL